MSKSYLIIGASTGIGFGLTRQLVNDGNHVYAVARNQRDLASLPNVTYIEYDVLSDETLKLDAEVLDGYAYCPGTINLKPFHRLKKQDFLNDFSLNVLGAIDILQMILPALKKGNNPSILLFSTVAAQQGMEFHTSVAASKGAIESIVRSLAAELAPGIRVNAVAPSITDTPLASRLLSNEEKKAASGKRHPLQRVGTVEDVANAGYFLLTDKSTWITGQILGIDGGMSTLRML